MKILSYSLTIYLGEKVGTKPYTSLFPMVEAQKVCVCVGGGS